MIMRDTVSQTVRRCVAVTTLSLTTLLLETSATPVDANIFSKLGQMYGCIVTWGQVCDMSDAVIGTGTGPVPQAIPVTCAPPLLNGLPQFLSWPEGAAKYRFQGTCSSPAKPGAVMTVRWEGSWTPSETKTDRPNASETLEITGFEPFLPDRAPGGKIFMYWTARCGKDPWLRASVTATGQRGSGSISPGQLNPFNNLSRVAESDGCAPFGAYVPDDLRQAFPDIDKHSFPRTGTILSATDKRRLNAEYERVNPSYFSRMGIQPRPSSNALQAPIPPSTGIVPKPSAQLKIFSRGTETAESTQPETQGEQAPSVNVAPPSVPPLSEGMDDSPSLPPVVITFDGPLHFISINGEDTPFNAGIYEIEPVLDLQLSLTREGDSPVFLSTTRGTHSETIAHPIALLLPGESNEVRHVVFLTPDGKRFDAVGSKSAVRSRDVTALVALPDSKIRNAMISASSGAPLPPCKQNSLPYGPRWIPVPCAMPTGMPGGLPAVPIPYIDGSNMLHACLNNNTGSFRIVRSFDNCGTAGEVKLKWQLAP
jgi:hypothetical protein